MDLTPDDDQEALRSATEAWLADKLPLEGARDRGPDIWRGMAEMGWIGMTTPDIGLDHATEALVFAQLGIALAPVAAISSSVAARWCGVEGKVALAVGSRLIDAEGADMALGAFDGKVGHFSAGCAGGLAPTIDPGTWQRQLVGDPSPILLDDPRAFYHLRLLSAAYAVGCAEGAARLSSDYAKLREQFGKPIGSFQAIKHICADMAVRGAVARSQLYYAACALDADDPRMGFHVAAASRLADRAAIDIGRAAVQVHGGIGMTDEAAPHLFLKRAHLLQFVTPVARDELLA